MAGSTSLVLYPDTVDEKSTSWDGLCPKKPLWLVEQNSGVMVPASCNAYRCPVCGPRKASRLSRAATWAVSKAPRARFITLTQVPEDWQQARQKIRDYRRLLTKRGYAWEWFWALERGSKTGMLHAHGIQHGDYVPQGLLQDVWGHRVDIRGVGKADGASSYLLKDAARVTRYGTKGATADMPEHLALNGGRAAHWSRGFLHGRTLDEAYAEMSAGDEGEHSWELMNASDAAAFRARWHQPSSSSGLPGVRSAQEIRLSASTPAPSTLPN